MLEDQYLVSALMCELSLSPCSPVCLGLAWLPEQCNNHPLFARIISSWVIVNAIGQPEGLTHKSCKFEDLCIERLVTVSYEGLNIHIWACMMVVHEAD